MFVAPTCGIAPETLDMCSLPVDIPRYRSLAVLFCAVLYRTKLLPGPRRFGPGADSGIQPGTRWPSVTRTAIAEVRTARLAYAFNNIRPSFGSDGKRHNRPN